MPLPLDAALAPRPRPGFTVTRMGLRTMRAPRAAPRMLYRPLMGGWHRQEQTAFERKCVATTKPSSSTFHDSVMYTVTLQLTGR